ncbi:MAG TPA: hypothetical protein VFI84_02120 [Candidatus Saccharimonadales bacterium]|nr:hypothetical protein [Candidatus Saccharimonadales bacterium]
MRTPEFGMRDLNSPPPEREVWPETQEEFGNEAVDMAETYLQQEGRHIVVDGVAKVRRTWTVGWHFWRRFAVEREDVDEVNEDTLYTLTFSDMTTKNTGMYVFNRKGLRTLVTTDAHTKEHLEEQLGSGDLVGMHQKDVLDQLGSEPWNGTGY